MPASVIELRTGFKSEKNMVGVELENVDVTFTIYQSSARSLRTTMLKSAVGGFVGTDQETGRVTVRALDNISVHLRPGDRLALLGHNGAGKTTLLRTMAGIYHPTAGRITSFGTRVPLFDIHLGLDDEATGYENIFLRGMMLGLSRGEIEDKVDDIIGFSGLGNFLDLPIRTYSSGMVLRLLFSIATSVHADILLMDEWIATGDQQFMNRAQHRLRDLVSKANILVIGSHNLSLLQDLCTRAILLEEGKIVFEGSVTDAVAIYSKASA